MPPNLPKLLRFNLQTLPITFKTNKTGIFNANIKERSWAICRLYGDDKLLATLSQSPDFLLLENTRNIQGPGSLEEKKENNEAQKYSEQRAVLKNIIKEPVTGQVQQIARERS